MTRDTFNFHGGHGAMPAENVHIATKAREDVAGEMPWEDGQAYNLFHLLRGFIGYKMVDPVTYLANMLTSIEC